MLIKVNESKIGVSPAVETSKLINCLLNAVILLKKDKPGGGSSILETNNSARELFRYNRKEFMSLSIENLFHPHTYKKIALAENTDRINEGFCVTGEERTFPVEFYFSILNPEEETYLLVIKDITQRKENEQQLARYIEELHENKDLMEKNAYELVVLNLKLEESESLLKEMNESKDKLFSIIAHDLRSPFSAFIGLTEIIEEDFDDMEPEEVKTLLAELNKSAKGVYGLLENLLNWSRLQTGRMEYFPEFISPVDSLNKTLSLFEGTAKQKRISLTSCIHPVSRIYADKNMVETVLRNLVSNAIKFTKEDGEVVIALSGGDDVVEFSVKDSGVGIDKETLAKFFRTDAMHSTKGTNNETGSGLGLLLCKELVERNKGSIRVESELGVGTKFSFTVPIGMPAEK